MTKGKCPYCNTLIHALESEEIPIASTGPQPYKGIQYLCPECSKILGVQIDPLAIEEDLLERIVKKLRQP